MSKINLFAQIISKLDRSSFKSLVKEKETDKHQKGYNSWTHLVSMLFCQFAKSQSVRDISNGLKSATGNLNHLGIQKAPSKSTISYQNKNRDWQLFKDFIISCLWVSYACRQRIAVCFCCRFRSMSLSSHDEV